MKNFLLSLLIFLFIIEKPSAQIFSVSNSASITACGASMPINIRFSSNAATSLNLSVQFQHGFEFVSAASSRPFTLDTTDLDHPVFTLTGPFTSADTLQYSMRAICGAQGNQCQFITQSKRDTIKINGVQAALTNPYTVNSPCLRFNANDVVNYSYTGIPGQFFYRHTIIRNQGSTSFSGDLSFSVKFGEGLLVESVYAITSNGTHTDLDFIQSADSAWYKARFSNITNAAYITIVERVKILSCLDGNKGNSSFSILYGCTGGELCDKVVHAQTATISEGNMDLIITPISFPKSTCYIGQKDKGFVIKNNGGAIMKDLDLKFTAAGPFYYITAKKSEVTLTASSASSHVLKDSSNFCCAYDTNFLNTSCGVLDSDSIITFQYYKIDTLYPGESLIFSWKENYCCPDPNHPYSFGGIGQDGGGEIKVDFKDICGNQKPKVTADYKTGYYFMYQLPIENDKSDIANGEVLNVEVNNITLYLDPMDSSLINFKGSELKIRLRLDAGLTLQNLPGVEIKPLSGASLLPYKTIPVGNGNSIDGDTVEAYFRIPSNLYTVSGAWGNFWNNSKVLFSLIGTCPTVGKLAKPKAVFVQEIFFIPDTSSCATNCPLPLTKNSSVVFVHCPGCPVPGIAINSFKMKRTTLGEADEDDNLLPDNPGQKADPANTNIKLNRAMIGDTVKATMTSYITNGTITYDSLGFDFHFAEYRLTIPKLNYFKITGAKVSIKHSTDSVYQTITYPLEKIITSDPEKLSFDLSIDTLKKYGFDTTNNFPRYEVSDLFSVDIDMVVIKNTYPNYIEKLEDIDNYMYVTGVPLNATLPGDINESGTPKDSAREYWCEAYGGNFTLVGMRETGTIINQVINARIINGQSDPCSKEVKVLSGYFSYEQSPINLFPYEYRRVADIDSVVYKIPYGYLLDSVYVENAYVRHAGYKYQSPQTPVTPDNVLVNGDATYVIFHPSSWYNETFIDFTSDTTIGNFYYPDEFFDLAFRFFISPQCNITPDSSYDHYSASTFNSLPGITTNSTFITTTSGIKTEGYLLAAPKPDLELIPDSIGIQAQNKKECFTNLSLKNHSSLYNATHTFVTVVSPSGRFNLTEVHEAGDTSSYPNIKDIYQLGTIPAAGDRKIRICGTIDCRQSSARDSIYIIYGWNCGDYPSDLTSLCNVDTNVYYIESPNAGLQVIDSVQAIVSLGDTLTYKLKVQASGIGSIYNIKIKANLPSDSILSYNSSFLQFPADSTTGYVQIEPYFVAKDSVVWLLDSLPKPLSDPFIERGINAAEDSSQLYVDIIMNFKVLCGYSLKDVEFEISGVTYCGLPVSTEKLSKPVILKGLTLPVVNAGSDTILCPNTSITLGSLPEASNTYSWIPATGLSNDSIADPMLFADATRTYTLTVRDTNNCVNRDSVLISLVQVIANAGNDTSICAGNSVQIGSAKIPGHIYAWTPSTGLSSDTIANPVATPSTTTTYILNAENGSCTESDTIIVTVAPLPQKPNVTGPSQVCQGSANAYSATSVSGVNFNLVIVPTGSSFTRTGDQFTVTSGSQSGNLVFRATNIATGCTRDANIFVNVNPLPQKLNVSGPVQVCAGSTNSYSISGVSGVSFSLISLPPNCTATGTGSQSGGITFSVTFGSTSGNAVFRATNTATGCKRDTSIFVNVLMDCCPTINYFVNGGSSFTSTYPIGNQQANFVGGGFTFNGVYHITQNLAFYGSKVTVRPGSKLYFDKDKGITLYASTLTASGAEFNSVCNDMWTGIIVDVIPNAMGTIVQYTPSTITLSNSGSTRSKIFNSKEGIKVGYNSLNFTNTFSITGTDFFNNYYSIQVKGGDGGPNSNSGISSNTFNSDPNSMKKPYKKTSSSIYYYSQAAIRLSGRPQEFSISGNTIENQIYGIVTDGGVYSGPENVKVYNNTFRDNYKAGIFTVQSRPQFLTTVIIAAAMEITNNNFYIPNIAFSNPQVSVLDPVMGVYVENNKFIIKNNLFQSYFQGAKTRQGVYNAVWGTELIADIQENTFNTLHSGVKVKFLDPSVPEVSSNTFTDIFKGVDVTLNTYSSARMQVRCNTFNASTVNFSSGVFVEVGAQLNPLGSAQLPNGNKFNVHILGAPVQYNGNGFGDFQYVKYKTSIQENGFSRDLFGNQKSFLQGLLPANQGSCPGIQQGGAPGVSMRVGVNAGDGIKEMKDSLKMNVGNFQDLKYYQHEIIKYHTNNNTAEELESYTLTLAGNNDEAYNTLDLYLMHYYKNKGQGAKASACKNRLLAKNPFNEEIKCRTKSFDLIWRLKDSLAVPAYMDSLDLAYIAASGTALAEVACIQLKYFYPLFECNANVSDTSHVGSAFRFDASADSLAQTALLGDVVPNPASNEASINYSLPYGTEKAGIVIYDIVGNKKMVEYEIRPEEEKLFIDLSGYKPGIYMYTLMINDNPVDTKKMIIIK